MVDIHEVKRKIDQAQMPFYVYILFRPSGQPFYVGKGKEYRIFHHHKEDGRYNRHKVNIIKKSEKEGLAIGYEIDSWHINAESAYEREKQLIASIGRFPYGPLVNLSNGGDGNDGYRHTEEWKARQAEDSKKKWSNPLYQDRVKRGLCVANKRPETIAKRSAALKKRAKEMVNKHYSDPENYARWLAATFQPESNIKRKESNLRSWSDSVLRDRQSEISRKTSSNPEVKCKRSTAQTQRMKDPKERDRIRLKNLETWSDPSKRLEQSQKMRRFMADPKRRDRLSASLRKRHSEDKELKERIRQSNLKTWSCPELREKQRTKMIEVSRRPDVIAARIRGWEKRKNRALVA